MKNRGFTLIELLVAMGIMAVLTAMAAFNFNQSRVRARDVQRKNDLSQLQKALELYRNDNNEYPAADMQTALKTNSYTKVIFADPRASEWQDYVYLPGLNNKTYNIMACLENTADSTKTTLASGDCNKFDPAKDCKCGSPTSKTGVMYIISQP